MKTKKKAWLLCALLFLVCLFPLNTQAATKARAGVYQKTYKVSAGYKVMTRPANVLVVTKVSGKKITFVVEHYGINASPLYQTNTITATIKKNKVSKFKWKDSWGNSGTGSLKFSGKKVTVAMKTKKTASLNRWGWWNKETLTYKRKLKKSESKYYSDLKF